jgi:hypothetical protein
MAQVILWEDAGFDGDKLVLNGDDLLLGNNFHFDGLKLDSWNDEASSIEGLGGKARFWSDAFHEGKFVDLGPRKYDLPALIQHGIANVYRPRSVRHRIAPYAASAAG